MSCSRKRSYEKSCFTKRRSTFWYQSYYCYIAGISIVDSDGMHSAVEFSDDSDYTVPSPSVLEYQRYVPQIA